MAKRPPLSKAELEVARVLWRLGEATVRQIHAAVCQERPLDFTTVQTYVRRLAAKGYLRTRRAGRAIVYKPRVPAGVVVRETVEDLLKRLFDGQALPMFRHLILDRGLSNEEIEQLRKLLDQWEGQLNEPPAR